MEAQVSSGLFDYKQVKSEEESPLETVWSEEHECVPLKQRLKMLRAKALLKNRNEIPSQVVNKEDEDFNEDFDHVSLKERQRMLLSRESVRSNRPAMEVFSQQQSFLKFAPLWCGGRGEKTSYCLACLISLVEQIKRLITAMKLTSCTRLTLIENRALTVGDDLTEGEARVLMEYGWIPNTGLGTMLNYCDRVVHDRKSEIESDGSEWRSKIGKILTDGYNGGIIIPNDIPKKVMEYGLSHTPEIKLEY